MAITFAFVQIYGICFVRVHSLSQDLALLPGCSISVSRSSKPTAFPAFNRLRPVASSSSLTGLVSSVSGNLRWRQPLGVCGEGLSPPVHTNRVLG